MTDRDEAGAGRAWAASMVSLVETSRAGGSGALVMALPLVGAVSLLVALALTVASAGTPGAGGMALGLLGVSVACTLVVARVGASLRRERRGADQARELVALREWRAAAGVLSSALGRPVRLASVRGTLLVHLAQVLGRWGFDEEAAEVAEAVSRDESVEPAVRFGASCLATMMMLRDGRLFDAGEEIARLRREVSRAEQARRTAVAALEEAAEEARETRGEVDEDAEQVLRSSTTTTPLESAGLSIVEVCRDVQTRHDAEVVEAVEAKAEYLKASLGVLSVDALALRAVSRRRLGDLDGAGNDWRLATALATPAEWFRRYPETRELADLPATSRPQPVVSRPEGGSYGR